MSRTKRPDGQRLISAAVAYGKIGFKIFPIKAGTKDTPLCKWGIEATSDELKIRRMWKQHPEANIGFACGQSNIFVVDIDTKDGRRGQQTIDILDIDHDQMLSPTLTQRTPSGGLQMFYRGDGPSTQNVIGSHLWPDGISHVDTKGTGGSAGGYVLLAPSVTVANPDKHTHAGSYKWISKAKIAPIDPWVTAMCNAAESPSVAASQTPEVELDTPDNINSAVHFLTHDAKNSIEGSGGEKALFDNVAVLKDHGISEQMAVELIDKHFNRERNIDAMLDVEGAPDWPYCSPLWEHGTEDDPTTLSGKIHNVYTYATENAPGSKTPEAEFAGDLDPETPEEIAAREKQAKRKEDTTELKNAACVIQDKLTDWAYVIQMDRFVQMSDTQYILKTPVFDNKFAYLKPKKIARLSKLLFEHRIIQMFDKSVFRPGEPPVTEDGNFNFYTQSSVVPAKGDTTSWDRHLQYLFPDEASCKHLLNWLAWFLQNLAKKPKHALLIAGAIQGTGKSFIAEVLTRILDKRNVSPLGASELSSSFNRWAVASKLLVIEELRAIERREIANKLHPIITQETIPINDKGIATYPIDNCFGIIAMTNDDAAISLDNSDRRYLVVRTDATPKSAAYYKTLYGLLNDPAFVAAVAHQLMTRDVGAYNGQASAPRTAVKEEMIAAGRSELETWLHEQIGNPPFTNQLIAIADVIEALPSRLERSGRVSNNIAAFLRDVLKYVNLGRHNLTLTRKVTLWGRPGIVDKLSTSERASLYITKLQASGAARPGDFEEEIDDEDLGL